ncbi:MAG: hypothetical protein GXO83_09565 [Chlorobi bacterium]|nr:hypothetical protein [Chlorobiota bacterium]
MDNAVFKPILRNTIILTLLLFVVGTILFSTVLKTYYLPVYLLLGIIFFIVTLLYSMILIRAIRKKPQRFIAWFMGVTTAKFLLYLMIMILYLLFYREHAIPFLLTFLILYFFYTPLAILQTLKAINHSREN